jgi:trehalose-phosphatase
MLHSAREQLLARYGRGHKLVLLFDYDGTLVPLAPRPHLARLAPERRRLLKLLARYPRLVVGIISGRQIEDLANLVGLPALYYSGTSGLELALGGVRIEHPEAAKGRALIAEVVPRLEAIAARYPGVWVEHKSLGIALHYFSVAGPQQEALRAEAELVLHSWTGRLRVVEGPRGMEITPALGWTKGSALSRIVTQAGSPALALYAGNDRNDQDALEQVAALGGIAIGVGPRAPLAAQHRVPDPAALWQFLFSLPEALSFHAAGAADAVAAH